LIKNFHVLKKLAFIIAIIVFIASNSFAQTWNWAQQGTTPLGIGDSGAHNPGATVTSITMDSSHNVFTGGYFSDSLYFGSTVLVCLRVKLPFITKYDSTGKLLWARQAKVNTPGAFFKQNLGEAISITTDRKGNVFETGYFHDTINFGAFKLVSHAYSGGNISGDVFLVKYSPSGNVIWARQSIGAGYGGAWGSSLKTDSAGNIYVSGNFYDTLRFGIYTLLTTYMHGSFFLVKYDSNGNLLWAKQSAGNNGGYEGVSNISMDSRADIYMSGLFFDTITWGTNSLVTPNSTKKSIFINKFDNNGVPLWARQIDGDSIEDWGCSMTTDNVGDIYIATIFVNNINIGAYHFYNPVSSVLFARYNTKGNVIWAKTYRGVYNWFNSVSVDSAGHVYLSATADTGVFGADTLYGQTLVKFDSAGNVMCGSAIQDLWGAIIAEPKGNGVYIDGSVLYNFFLGAYNIGPPDTGYYSWPFVAKWAGCKDNDFYATDSTKSPCKWQCNGIAKAIPSGGKPPYIYSWNTNPKQTTQAASALCPGNYIVMVKDFNQDTTYQLVTVPQPTDNVKVSAIRDSICAGKSILLSAKGASSYSWTPASGLNCTTCASPVANPIVTTLYQVTGTDTLGCKDTSYITLSVLPLPGINKGGNICQDSSFNLRASGGTSYIWNTGETSANITVSPLNTTTYSVGVNVGNNTCIDTLYSTVTVRQAPVISVCCDSVISTGLSVQLIASGGNKYLWQPSVGLNCDTCNTPVAKPYQTTTYTVLVTNDSGCSSKAFVSIKVNCDVFIPEAFSPNGDGKNDYLYVRGACIKEMNFMIFDRWGNKVFETTDQNIPWDGKYIGKPLNPDTYFYYLAATLLNGSAIEKKGNISLVR
jgi:gliding motility-associated-like protein